MTKANQKHIQDMFRHLGHELPQGPALPVTAPADGGVIAQLAVDTAQSLDEKIWRVRTAQQTWSLLPRRERALWLEKFAAAIRDQRSALAELIVREAGKTQKEAEGETDGSADVILKTIKDATLPDLNNMQRVKERPPVGVVGLITSFNFPLVVAHWTLAPALLAGCGAVWKPSEKTPLVALALKSIFDKAMGIHGDLLQIAVGARDIGEALVAHEQVDMVSATGSVAMGKAIRKTLSKKENNHIRPILELGGNNGAVISGHAGKEHLAWAATALMGSFLGTSGQRCTNTRRLIVHKSVIDEVVELLKGNIETFLASGEVDAPNDFGYGPLIDEDAFRRFEHAKAQVMKEGGRIIFGKRLLADRHPHAFYVEPALAVLPAQTGIMHEETFAPILFIAPYGEFEEALQLVNAPDNAGLVAAIYTQNQKEADAFAARCTAGHCLINPPKGTGTPAHGMGFGGNKDSGEGEILNSADPLAAFTRPDRFTRIAQNKDISMDK